jgi:hypothetical protein
MKRLTIISLTTLLTASAAPTAFGWGYHGGGFSGGSYHGAFGGSFSRSGGHRRARQHRLGWRRLVERERLPRWLRLRWRRLVEWARGVWRHCLGRRRVATAPITVALTVITAAPTTAEPPSSPLATRAGARLLRAQH